MRKKRRVGRIVALFVAGFLLVLAGTLLVSALVSRVKSRTLAAEACLFALHVDFSKPGHYSALWEYEIGPKGAFLLLATRAQKESPSTRMNLLSGFEGQYVISDPNGRQVFRDTLTTDRQEFAIPSTVQITLLRGEWISGARRIDITVDRGAPNLADVPHCIVLFDPSYHFVHTLAYHARVFFGSVVLILAIAILLILRRASRRRPDAAR